MIITKENIFEEAKRCNLEVLKSDLVNKVKDNDGETPLHILAHRGVKEVLDHPSVDLVKDDDGNTPLHFLACDGVKEVLDHPSVDQVKNRYGWTPLQELDFWGYLTKEDLRKRFPWYKKEIKDVHKAVKEIVDTPTSVRFILEDS